MEKLTVSRKVVNRATGDIREFQDDIYTKDVGCLYQDEHGVYILLKGGYLIKVEDVTLDRLTSAFGL